MYSFSRRFFPKRLPEQTLKMMMTMMTKVNIDSRLASADSDPSCFCFVLSIERNYRCFSISGQINRKRKNTVKARSFVLIPLYDLT